MPRIARNLLGEFFIHNMVQGINREFIFENDKQKQKYLNLMKKYSQKYELLIISYCIMDNHAHLLTYTNDTKRLSLFMKDINTEYALYYNKLKNRVGYVFRNRFTSKIIYDQNQLYTCIKYIHMNPVKAKIVNSEEKYKFSSYNDYINKNNFTNSKILNLVFLSEENYIEKFKSIKYQIMNLENETIKIEEVLEQFIIDNKQNINNKKIDSTVIKEFIKYLKENEYEFTKVEIANALNMSRATFYRKLEKGDDKK